MKKLYLLIGVIWITSFSYASSKVHQTIRKVEDKVFVISNQREYEALPIISVKYHNLFSLHNQYNVLRNNKLSYADIEIPSDYAIDEFVSTLEKDNNIIGIDYNSLGEYNSITPNDTSLNLMWHIPVIHANDAWSITLGKSSIIVGVLDSGTDWMHPDLGNGTDGYQNIYCKTNEDDWSNSNNPTTGNHVDDDSNGLIDDYKGWNFDLNTNDSRGSFYHGTFVASIIAAKTNNHCGVAGIAGGYNSQGVSILPYCVGMIYPNTSIIDDAIIAAVDEGAHIIQFSLSCGETDAIKASLQYAKNNGVIVVCASGNNYNSYLPFPANDTTVIAVGAIDKNSQKANFSNYGSNLRLVAPGVDIYGLNLSNAPSLCTIQSGTSFAAPQVSATIALMLSANPYLSRNEIITIIESTAQKVGTYTYSTYSNRPNGTWNDSVGYGLIDAYAAVKKALRRYPIQGPDYVCDTAKYYLKHPLQQGETVSWSVHNGVVVSPSYSIIGATNQDTVTVVKTTMGTVIRNENTIDLENILPPFPSDTIQKLKAIINGGNNSDTIIKIFRKPINGDVPTITASNNAVIWTSGTSRTFSITNCTSVPDSLLQWEIKTEIYNYLGGTPTISYSYATGRTLTYTPVIPPLKKCRIYITAINSKKECPPNSTTLSYMVNRKISLSTMVDDDILNVNISEDITNATPRLQSPKHVSGEFTLELWHAVYGRLRVKKVSNTHEQIDIRDLPKGVYVLILKDDTNIIAEEKTLIF